MIALLFWIIVVGLLAYFVYSLPIPQPFKTAAVVVLVLILVIVLFDVLGGYAPLRLPAR